MTDPYLHDVYLSYARGGHVERWVRNHLRPELGAWLEVLTPRPVSLVAPGAADGRHARDLERSRLLVAVLTPNHFHCDWCLSEWRGVLERERALGMASVDNPRALVYRLVFAGLERLPEEATARRWLDFREHAVPYEGFRRTERWLAFSERVKELATDIADTLPNVPRLPPAAARGPH